MGFIDKVKDFATGKSATERMQEAAANKLIRKDVMAAQLQTRREEAIKFAKEKEKFRYEQQTKKLRQPSNFNSGFGNLGTPFGSPRFSQAAGPRRNKRNRQLVQEKTDLIFGGISSGGRYRVI
jgi:hypothetical protein